jgi:hypothetical protein
MDDILIKSVDQVLSVVRSFMVGLLIHETCKTCESHPNLNYTM